MARALTSAIQDQINNKAVKIEFVFKINGTDYSSYLIDWSNSFDVNFGSASAIFNLDNNGGQFSPGGISEIKVGDTVELIEKYSGDSTEFKRFYGLVEKRSIEKTANRRVIRLQCLDYISSLQHLDLDLTVEGTKNKVENETLSPVYLASPNDDLAQLFNFANDSIATDPLPNIKIVDNNHSTEEYQWDGFEIYYDVGQLKLGVPLNVRYNYTIKANYWYYSRGVYVEDVIKEILTQPDGYGGYLFGEATAQAVIDNHLKTTFSDEEGTTADTLVPNTTTVDAIIETTLTADVDGGDTVIYVSSTQGFPDSGSAEINGDIFTWSSKTATTLEGIPTTGSNAIKAHKSGDYVTYTKSCAVGQVWYLSYNNIITDLTESDFNLPSGYSIEYFDKKYGKIILNNALSTSYSLYTTSDYSFYTLQASGIEINKITFRSREIRNRYEALKKVKSYVAPNYIIRTQGDNKIWASYVTQKTSEDYTLTLMSQINYQEDEDIYTRVLMWGKNSNPTNIMFGDDVDYTSDTEDSYTGTVSKTELDYFGEEKSGILSEWASGQLSEAQLIHQTELENLINFVNDTYIKKDYASQPSTGYHIFGSSLTNVGKIILGDTVPIVYVNNVPIDNQAHQQVAVPIKIKQTTRTITEGGGKSKSVSVTTYYYYTVIFPHASLVPSEPIYLYDNQGVLRYTISPNDPNVNYAEGIWTIPGIERNDVAEILSTATYYVLYSTDKLSIDYDNTIIKIHNSLVPDPENVTITATFEYWAIIVRLNEIRYVVDGRRNTQFHLEFFGEPPAGFHLATVDLGATYPIQAIDIIGGFYKPDDTRKFEISFNMTMKYSTDGTNFYSISDKTENFKVDSTSAVKFEEDELGSGLEARYLKFTLDSVEKIDYGRGRYVVAITELAVYKNIIIEGEGKLIPTAKLTADVNPSDTTIYVESTEGFDEPESGETKTAYLDEDTNKSFTYTGLTSTSFTGCTISSGVTASSGEYVVQEIEGDTTLYDEDGLLRQLGDRVTKVNKISKRNLFTQDQINYLAKAYLREYYKEHSKVKVDVLYSPYLKVGQTVLLTDSYGGVNTRYFIERVSEMSDRYSLVLARYPGD